jgi:hypothetical protein
LAAIRQTGGRAPAQYQIMLEGKTMKPHYISAILAISAIAFSDGAMAQNMSMREYKAAEKAIESEYQTSRSSCDPFAGNAKDICMAVAKGRERIAKAELEARYKPGLDADYEVNVARGKADYAVARQKCNDQADNLKEVCIRKVQAALARAMSDARTQLKMSEAIESDNTIIINAHMRAKEENEKVRREVATHKREVSYTAEKCAASSGDSKTHRESEAKLQCGN